jgi:leucyl aminopeptidase (aminopeptidase T)
MIMTGVLRNIFTVNLAVKKRERVLIFNDKVSSNMLFDEDDRERMTRLRSLTMLLAEIGKELCKETVTSEYTATGSHGAEPPAELWECAFGPKTLEILQKEHLMQPLLKKTMKDHDLKRVETIVERYRKQAVDCVIALSNFSTSHTKFRDFLTRICQCRYASMPLFDVSMLEGPMNIDWKNLARRTRAIAKTVNTAESIRLKTPNGTKLTFSKRGRKALPDTGILTRPGSFSNLPAGEVYLAPVEGTARGRLVLEWAPTKQLSSPITLDIQDGFVQGVTGDDPYADYLRQKLEERDENSNIAEFGIGTNEAAKRPDNILESEKILGTVHIALGDNSSFGGNVKTPFHQDFIFFRPTVTLMKRDGSENDLLRDGKCVM